ncbi:recombinase zinc beta ribbon domain-containing protein [Geminicoccus flavidas]|uniref:recombinase zinc beta ribbon domain-containing protein n=1 Tax=Geminicoccus flavidas TaxID=2506407 RepID=UPI0038B3B25E
MVNGPTFLAGIARCGHCGAALIQNTGKGGTYRYYCCSRRLKQGQLACVDVRMQMDRLDDIVLGEVTKRVLHPERLTVMLDAYLRTAQEPGDRQQDQLRQDHKEAEAGITRLLELVEKGVLDASDASLRERLVNLRFRRDELTKEIGDLQRRLASAEPAITPEKVVRLAVLLRDKLYVGPPDLRQAYARLVLSEVSVDDQEICISGSKAILARTAAEGLGSTAPSVLSFVRGWCARRDSNPRPQD